MPEPVSLPEDLEVHGESLRQSAWVLAEFWLALKAQHIPETAATEWVNTWWDRFLSDQYGVGEG